MSCKHCSAPCEGAVCQQCAIELANEHLAAELASDEEEVSGDE